MYIYFNAYIRTQIIRQQLGISQLNSVLDTNKQYTSGLLIKRNITVLIDQSKYISRQSGYLVSMSSLSDL